MEYQKAAEATSDLVDNKITKVSQNSHQKIQKHFQMNMIKKYLKKDIYL